MFKLLRKCGGATWRRLISEDPTVKGNSAGRRGRSGQQAPEGQERSQGPQAQTPHGHQVWRLLLASQPSQQQVLKPKKVSTAEMRQEPEEQPGNEPHLRSCSFIPFEASSSQVYRSHSSPDCKLQEDRNPPCLTPPYLHSVCKLGAQEMAFSGRKNQ